MELKEFIKETLVQICEGIKEAQAATKSTGAIISPAKITGIGITPFHGNVDITGKGSALLQVIKFSIVLNESTNSNKGIGVKLAGIGGDIKDQKATENQTSVEFSVPIVFPTSY